MSGRDLGASVRQRLLNQSRAQNRPFQELLQYFAMERFLYRLARSPYADQFILKGALLLTAWRAPLSRPTMDIDLAGRTNNELDHIKEIIGAVCEASVSRVTVIRLSVKVPVLSTHKAVAAPSISMAGMCRVSTCLRDIRQAPKW